MKKFPGVPRSHPLGYALAGARLPGFGGLTMPEIEAIRQLIAEILDEIATIEALLMEGQQ